MSKINRFEDLICWQKARELVKRIYLITKNDIFYRDYDLKSQILRASYSIMLNISEGFGRRTHKEFKNFLFYSHGSVNEVQSALYIALDQKYLEELEFKQTYLLCEEIAKIISGLIKSLK